MCKWKKKKKDLGLPIFQEMKELKKDKEGSKKKNDHKDISADTTKLKW